MGKTPKFDTEDGMHFVAGLAITDKSMPHSAELINVLDKAACEYGAANTSPSIVLKSNQKVR